MKVVLFCGGFGMRLRDYSESVPKPLVNVGYRPILWHVMKYYAHFGHRDFILCLGWQATAIKNYFLKYDECVSNDFVLSNGGAEVELLNSDIHDWKITFVDTGANACVGERLRAVRKHLKGEDAFFANYTDGLTDLHLPDLVDAFQATRPVGMFLSVHPRYQTFHTVETEDDGLVRSIQPVRDSKMWMNGGFFLFRQEIFDYLHEGEELVHEPFQRLIAASQLRTLRYPGFWACMDTFKEKAMLDDMVASGSGPWEVWRDKESPGGEHTSGPARLATATPAVPATRSSEGGRGDT